MTRRFYVRTYGCQMNEHDSERIAGLLVDRGHGADRRPRRGRRRRAQHLLHPRERRQQALRPSRPAEGAEGATTRPADRGRRLPRPEGPRPGAASGRRTSTSCSARTTSADAPALLRTGAGRGADRRDPRRARGVPVGAAGAARRRPRGVGHDPDRLRQLVRVLHRAVGARQGGEPAHGRHRARGRGAGRATAWSRSRCSARTSTPTAATSAPVSTGRSSPTCCARSTRSTASSGSGSRRRIPKDLRARDDRGDGRVRDGVRAPAPAAAVGERPHARAHAPRLHRGALPRPARRGARRDRRPRGHDRHHRRVPGRDRRRLRTRRSRSWTRRDYDAAYTFVFSPRPGTEAATMTDDFVAPEVVQERMDRLVEVGRAQRAAPSTRRASARWRKCSSKARRRRTRRLVGPHPPEQARALRAAGAGTVAGDLVRRPHHERGAALAAGRRWSSGSGRPADGACASRSSVV